MQHYKVTLFLTNVYIDDLINVNN